MKINPKRRNVPKEEREKEVKRQKVANGELPTIEEEVDGLKSVSSALMGGAQVDEMVAARQLNKALCMFANTLPEEEAMVISSVFPEWDLGVRYTPNEYVRYGLNADNEPQIYRVVQPHVSQYDWSPEKAVSLFKKVGFTEEGAALWVQPMGAHDAYEKDDEVVHNGKTYVSTINGNVWEPGVYGWIEKPSTPVANTKRNAK